MKRSSARSSPSSEKPPPPSATIRLPSTSAERCLDRGESDPRRCRVHCRRGAERPRRDDRRARGARVFQIALRPGLADCAPSARVRLDAIARWLQDVAYADVEDAGLDDCRDLGRARTRIRVSRFPRFGEHLSARTFCSGIGPMWAERRTTIAAEGAGRGDRNGRPVGPPRSGHPRAGAADRRRNRRLRDDRPRPAREREAAPPRPASTIRSRPGRSARPTATSPTTSTTPPTGNRWRRSSSPAPSREIDAEIEFRTPAQPGEKQVVRNGPARWIMGADGEAHASVLVHVARLADGGATSRVKP